jgi:secreted PhoX family phosphatase
LSPNGQYLFTPSEAGTSEGITRLTLKGPDTGKKVILAAKTDTPAWSRVDGIKWYGSTGKGVLLASEELATGGIWQVDPDTGAFVRLDWMGNFSHEGVGLDAAGNLYLGDENRTGAIYKAVPNNVNDLTQGGTLWYLVGTGTDPTGWKQVTNPANAITEANNGGAILFDRPEDFDEQNGRVYFTVTEPKGDADPRHGNYNGTPAGGASALNQVVNRGGVYSLNTAGVPDLAVQSGTAPYTKLTPMIEVNDPTYINANAAKAQQGLQFPDNITFDGHGHLWVHEDIPDGASFPASGVDVPKQVRDQQDELYVYVLNSTGSQIVPNPAKTPTSTGPEVSGGYKAADMRTGSGNGPCENEFTGGIFGQGGKVLYINQQHGNNPTLTTRIG